MIIFQTALLIGVAFISMIPIIEMWVHHESNQFINIRIFMILIFVWSVAMIFKYMTGSMLAAYFVHFASYTLVLSIAYFLLRTIYEFFSQPFPKVIKYIMRVVLPLHLLWMLSNEWTGHILNVTLSEVETLRDIIYADIGSLMLLHYIMAYSFLFWAIAKLFIGYRDMPFKKHYKKPVLLFAASLGIVFPVNMWHLITGSMYVDPTYLSVVLLSYMVYMVVYKRNIVFVLSAEGRKNLLSNMREHYVLAKEDGRIVEISPSMLKRFNLKAPTHVEALLEIMKDHAVLYTNIDEVEDKSIDKPYLFTVKKQFSLDRYNARGEVYLFYDESKFVKLVERLESLQNMDIMTELLNRNFLEHNVEEFEANYDNFGIVLSDLNGLKLFNDNFGHKKGDELLLKYTKILKQLSIHYPESYIIRSGGDEFMIVLKDSTPQILEEIKQSLLKQTSCEDPLDCVSISVGIAQRRNNEAFEVVYKRADQALYKMKDEVSHPYQEALLKAINKQKE